jgi:hypothetical protein
MAASQAIESLDDFVAGLPKDAVLSGDPAKVSSIWAQARGDYAAAKRAEKIDTALEKAELQAGSAHSGQNIDNATRQKIKEILTNPKLSRGYDQTELAAMRRIVKGTFVGDVPRFLGNLLGGGGGLGMVVGTGTGAYTGAMLHGASGAAIGATVPVLGYAFKKLGNAITASRVDDLSTLIRSRSPLADQMRGPLETWGQAAQDLEISSTPRNIARLMIASRNLANNLKDAGIAVTETDLIKSLQGPSQGTAAPDQGPAAPKGDKYQ